MTEKPHLVVKCLKLAFQRADTDSEDVRVRVGVGVVECQLNRVSLKTHRLVILQNVPH